MQLQILHKSSLYHKVNKHILAPITKKHLVQLDDREITIDLEN